MTMAEQTARFAMPLLAAGQAAKELTHNEALTLVDMLMQPEVVAVGIEVPPAAPEPGQCWIVGSQPVGEWAGRADHLAGWALSGWRFVAPREGLAGWCSSTGMPVAYRQGVWHEGDVSCARVVVDGHAVVGARGVAIADPVGGAGDEPGRIAIGAILDALRRHGLIAR
jgi:hypothetical protein